MEETRNDQIEATTPANTETTLPSAEPSAEPEILGSAVERIARKAYARLAEELKFKGDFPEWESVSERGRGLYLDAVQHVQQARDNITATQAAVGEDFMALRKSGEERINAAEEAAKPRTRFEEIVNEIWSQ